MSDLRSKAITQGVERAPNRSMLRAVGFADADFDKPIVGVANAYSNITPCNLGLNDLAQEASKALHAGGAMPQVFGTITVSDGISMGTDGMRYSLVSREVIADSIETVCQGQCMDGVLAVGGCGGMYTANTMSSAIEAMGMSLSGSSTMPAEGDEKKASARLSGQILTEAIRNQILPRQLLTRKGFENAIAVVMAVGGSTNAVLHLLAIAHAAQVPLTLDDFTAIGSRVPVFCDLKPSGRYLAPHLHPAGGIPHAT